MATPRFFARSAAAVALTLISAGCATQHPPPANPGQNPGVNLPPVSAGIPDPGLPDPSVPRGPTV